MIYDANLQRRVGRQSREANAEPLKPADQGTVARIEKESLARYRRHVSDVNKARDREMERALRGA